MVADLLGDGLDGLLCGREQFRGTTHAQVSDLVHRAPAELTSAQAAEMFLAVTGFPGQSRQTPIFGQMRREPFPEQAESVIVLERLGEAADIGMNQFDPMLDHHGLRRPAAFMYQSLNGGMERQRFEGSDDRRGGNRFSSA